MKEGLARLSVFGTERPSSAAFTPRMGHEYDEAGSSRGRPRSGPGHTQAKTNTRGGAVMGHTMAGNMSGMLRGGGGGSDEDDDDGGGGGGGACTRVGRWTREEEAYSEALIEDFSKG